MHCHVMLAPRGIPVTQPKIPILPAGNVLLSILLLCASAADR